MPIPTRRISESSRADDGATLATLSGRLDEPVRTLVFFGLMYLYVWLWVQPSLIYGCATITNFPAFYRGWAFFADTVAIPGGATRYVAALASQLLEYSWAGAIVITAQAWALCACTGWLFRRIGLSLGRLLRHAPALLVLAAYARYSYHLPLFTAAMVSLGFACLYVRLTREDGALWRQIALFVVLAVLSHIVGGAAVLPFAAVCAAYEVGRKQWSRAGACALIGSAVPYVVGVLAFRSSLVEAYTDLLPLSWRILGWATRERMVAAVYGVYVLAVAGVLLGGLAPVLSARAGREEPPAEPVGKPVKARHETPAKARGSLWVRWVTGPAARRTFGSLLVFAAGAAVAVFAPDIEQKSSLQVHRYACRRMWPEVLAAARRCPTDVHVVCAVNLALYHTGRLGTDLFAWVQQPTEAGLLVTGEDHALLYWHAFDALIDLGLANLAEKNLTECLETFGEHPWILERLAKVNLIKGKDQAARIHLGALEKTLFHRKWAKDVLSRLEVDPNLAGDPEIQRLRSLRLRTDSTAQFYAPGAMLASLVEQGGGNRMAFEYLTAWYLLNGQLPKVADQLERLDEFRYAEIPPLWQEALLIYAHGSGKPVDLRGRSIHPETERRFKQFSSIARNQGNDPAAMAALARDYRGSYFLYFFSTKVANR